MHKKERVLEYDKPINYSNKVLIGKWFDNRNTHDKTPPLSYKHTTTYSDFFGLKPLSRDGSTLVWDLQLNAEESSFISQIGRHDYPNYFENFSTLYDLSYNHFPKCLSKELPRKFRVKLKRYEPMDEYLQSFGNITKYGVLDQMKKNWLCEIQDPRLTYSTQYRDTFTAPDIENYRFRRWGIPLANSSIMDPINLLTHDVKLRDRPSHNVPDTELLVEVPVEQRFNPITWEPIYDKNVGNK